MTVDIKEKEEIETKQKRSFIEPKEEITKKKKKRDKNNLVSTTIELDPEFRKQITEFYQAQGFSTLKHFFEYLVKKEMNMGNLSNEEKLDFVKRLLKTI